MKVIISSTLDDKYLFYLPITTFCWNKIGIDVICFLPKLNPEQANYKNDYSKYALVRETNYKNNLSINRVSFESPQHKEATYAQVSRLYAAALDLPEDEILVTSDIDMLVLNENYIKQKLADFDIFGSDLVPEKQIPLCYISASVKNWRIAMRINGRTYQQCLDELVGVIECQDFRGNQWSLDQHTAYNYISSSPMFIHHHLRARQGTQFATHRYDRDDMYAFDKLTTETVDAHLPRPGYTEENFEKIMTILECYFPNDNLEWIREYRNEYVKLIQ